MGVEERKESVYEALLDRFRSMEESEAKLRDEFHELLQHKRDEQQEVIVAADSHKSLLSCFFFSTSIYESVLKCMGHALHIYKPSSGEIIYWNDTAETLYGWKAYEIIGKRVDEFLISEEYYASLQKIVERLMRGVPWSGQFPLKKRSGEVFMAMASKILHRRHADDTISRNTSADADDEKLEQCSIYETKPHSRHHHSENTTSVEASEKDESTAEFGRTSKIAARVLAKLQIGGSRKLWKDNGSVKSNCTHENSSRNHDLSGDHVAFNPQQCVDMKKADTKVCAHKTSSVFKDSSVKTFSMEYDGSFDSPISEDPLLRFHCQFDPKRLEPEATSEVIEEEAQKRQVGLQLPSSGESTGSHESSSSKGDESNIVQCEIHWEDLELREEIGQGSYAVVHHGIWNGSDVAVKVYFGNGYTEETLQDYRKEIGIMKRLRHPNVLLFMGAVYSPQRLAIMTELLPRGSLFKILHNNNQTLDIRRRLRMALDVARGMNYLHRRNPPIVHRDLKSSNLLVDKNWTVKVGDFGLSKLKDATLLTTKSGRGTIVGVVGFMNRRLDLPEGLDPNVASIIHECWRSDPEERPSFEELIQRMMFLLNKVTAVPIRRISES
ncbi:unnamed protein product [Lupinus luteus]|uniref:non-specific serine/threonine protein kinase n=1 Tax=Lupinus luteus TaxID=3873 RepID=A0AAV1WYM4_LUPLU